MDYRASDVWGRVAAWLDGGCEPRPTTNCGRFECGPDWEWRARLHDYDLWLAVRGRGVMLLGEERFAISPGTLLLLRPGDRGWAYQDAEDRLTVVYLHFDLVAPGKRVPLQVPQTYLPSRYVRFHDAGPIEAMLTRIMRLTQQGDALTEFEAKLLLQQTLLMVYQQDAANQNLAMARFDRRVEQVMVEVRSRPERRVTLEQAAALTGLAPNYFSRLFTHEVGMSLRTFVLQARLDRARFLLEETTLSISQIAMQLGYDDLFLFSRQFKQRFGHSPRQARNPEPRS